LKTIIKLLIAAIIINGCVRCGLVAWRYYELKDATQQMLTFGARQPTETLQMEIQSKASELALPVTADDITVQREGNRTAATVKYRQPVELFPRYTMPVDLDFSVDSIAID
jgi:hypothetical protein